MSKIGKRNEKQEKQEKQIKNDNAPPAPGCAGSGQPDPAPPLGGGEWGYKGQCLLDAQPLGASGMGVILLCSVLFVRILDKTARICLVVQQELRVVHYLPH